MKAIMLMFDSLNRRYLSPYGCDWVHTPNFQRLTERTVTFDNSYAGSMPCMPARREIHTGRYNFLHREWGPIEPFDDSMPQILREHGIHSHLVSDDECYWRDGAATYHPRYASWEAVRGYQHDPWGCNLTPAVDYHPEMDYRVYPGAQSVRTQMKRNWHEMPAEADHCVARTFAGGLRFLETNAGEDHWFLHLEEFAPHEPFWCPEQYRELYKEHDWSRFAPETSPSGQRCLEPSEMITHFRYSCAALTSMCDAYLGTVLDFMDAHDLWQDTMLIVNTDHGNEMGEHGWWGKCVMPFYNTIVHTPLFIWDPRCGVRGERRQSLVQTIDLAPTLLEFFALTVPPDMQGTPLREVISADIPVRDAGLFGMFSGHVNVTDGRYVYMRAPVRPDGQPRNNYTLMPTHTDSFFYQGPDGMDAIELSEPFTFTKGMRVLKIPSLHDYGTPHDFGSLLFDLQSDPEQQHPVQNAVIEERMIKHLRGLLAKNDAPPEQYVRLGL